MKDLPEEGRQTRDRQRTEQKILSAATEFIAEEGFKALGVNKLAARAGVDKQLIYRYFGGLDGVIERIAQDVGFWYGAKPDIAREAPYGDLVADLLTRYIGTLRQRPLLRQALLWELSDRSETLLNIEKARSVAFQQWAKDLIGSRAAPAGVDAPAINALLLAGVHYLALREQTLGQFAGLKLESDADWQRVAAALRYLVQGAYEEADASKSD